MEQRNQNRSKREEGKRLNSKQGTELYYKITNEKSFNLRHKNYRTTIKHEFEILRETES